MKVSTGLRNHLLVTGSAKAALDGKVIRVYGSPTSVAAAEALVPATADAGIGTATLLATISVGGAGTGVTFDTTATSGVLAKAPAEEWKGTLVASGYFSFCRIVASDDDNALESTEAIRAQLTVGVLGKEVIVSSANKTTNDEQRLDQFYVGIPGE